MARKSNPSQKGNQANQASDKNYLKAITAYYKSVCDAYNLGNIESSYNAPIIDLLKEFGFVSRDMSGERKGKSGENIDIKCWHSESDVGITEPFAGIEVKKIGGIDERARNQIKIEVKSLGNAILTDNFKWLFWKDKEEKSYTGVILLEFVEDQIVLKKENIELFISILKDFKLNTPNYINSSETLAKYMASHAQTIRAVVAGILKDDGTGKETGMGQPLDNDQQRNLPMFKDLLGLYNKIKSELRPTLNVRDFSDMYAQTIVYGLFIARHNDKSSESFNRYEAMRYLQEESELLKQFFVHIATSAGSTHPTLEKVIDRLCNLYKICDIPALLGNNDEKDAIVHFFEDFLSFYDPVLRNELGVFYTPIQIVRYLISMVDNILTNEFDINGGLSNNEHIAYKVACEPYQLGKKWVKEKELSVPRIAILDPACGTGSFGAETIRYIKNKYFSGAKSAFWENYILQNDGLLSRLVGFEIMMTSYVVAHLKMRRTIHETIGYIPSSQPRINTFLTNTLTPPAANFERGYQIELPDFSTAITEEAYYADTWKIRRPIQVIMGNPPYNRLSANRYDISAYKTETDGITPFGEKTHWLYDDYVQFFCFSEQIIKRNKEGVLAFISNNGYLNGITTRGMRGSLLRTFDTIYIVNLHGDGNKQETTPDGSIDENVFKILQGVALFIGVRKTKKDTEKWAKVYYADLWGSRDSKFKALAEGNIKFTQVKIEPKLAYFTPFVCSDKDAKKLGAYDQYISISKLFSVNVSGLVTGNDKCAIASKRDDLEKRLDTVRNATTVQEVSNCYDGKFSDGQTAEKLQQDVLQGGTITRIQTKPFDIRWTFYSGRSCGWIFRPREKSTLGQLIPDSSCPIGMNLGMVFARSSKEYFAPFVSNEIILCRLFSASCIPYIAPLYLHSDDTLIGESWTENIDSKLYEKLTQYLSEKPSALEVFDYVYGILHDPVYADKYGKYLCTDFPRVPVVNDTSYKDDDSAFFVSEDMFAKYIAAGKKLRELHTLQVKKPVELVLNPSNAENMAIGKISYNKREGVLRLNPHKTIEGIPPEVWRYEIGGYKVLDKWFQEHKGEELTLESFTHIENITGALAETIKIREYLRSLH